jgi:hypothetical protein
MIGFYASFLFLATKIVPRERERWKLVPVTGTACRPLATQIPSDTRARTSP